MSEYLERQKIERKTMEWFTNEINNNSEKFREEFFKLHIIEQCRTKAFIQVRDSELYKKMLKILGEE